MTARNLVIEDPGAVLLLARMKGWKLLVCGISADTLDAPIGLVYPNVHDDEIPAKTMRSSQDAPFAVDGSFSAFRGLFTRASGERMHYGRAASARSSRSSAPPSSPAPRSRSCART